MYVVVQPNWCHCWPLGLTFQHLHIKMSYLQTLRFRAARLTFLEQWTLLWKGMCNQHLASLLVLEVVWSLELCVSRGCLGLCFEARGPRLPSGNGCSSIVLDLLWWHLQVRSKRKLDNAPFCLLKLYPPHSYWSNTGILSRRWLKGNPIISTVM